jgi:hypothetical protein
MTLAYFGIFAQSYLLKIRADSMKIIVEMGCKTLRVIDLLGRRL